MGPQPTLPSILQWLTATIMVKCCKNARNVEKSIQPLHTHTRLALQSVPKPAETVAPKTENRHVSNMPEIKKKSHWAYPRQAQKPLQCVIEMPLILHLLWRQH